MANEKRLIDADRRTIATALKVAHDSLFTPGEYEHSIYGKAALLLERDAVEVVRCKDCKYRVKSRWHKGYQCGNECDGMASGVELKDDDFCSYGERRENERTD